MNDKMTHTALICYITEKLKEQNYSWETQKELFYIFLPKYNCEKYRSKWNNWLNRKTESIQSEEIRSEISKTFKLDNNIWNYFSKKEQKRAVNQAIKEFVKPLTKNINPKLSKILPLNKHLNQEQENLLYEIEKSTQKEVEKLLLKNKHFFKKILKNQNFLLNLLQSLYQRGMYDFLNEYLFASILPHNLNEINIKIIHANTLGSLSTPNYLEAWSILNTISSEHLTPEIIDIRTILISNLRLYELERENLTKEELHHALPIFRQHYSQVFEYQKTYNYYPAINLMYILKIAALSSSNSSNITIEALKYIYVNATASLKKELHNASKEDIYYSKITNIEFQLLLEKYSIKHELEFLLDNDQPSPTWVNRTVRQLKFFTKIVTKFSKSDTQKIIKEFDEVIELLEDYIISKYVYYDN